MIFYIKIIFLLIFLWIKSCSGAEISNSLFPSTLGITNQNESIFIEHQIVSNSDVLLVKCPSHFYKHNNNNFKFTVNELIRDLQVKKIDSKNDTIIWYYIVNPKAEKENISLLCGELIFRSGGSTSLIQWIVNIVWKSKPNPLLTNDTYNAEGSLYSPKKCNGTNDLLPFIKYSRTQIIKMFNDKVDKVYKGDILYAFDLTKAIGPIEYLLPCSIDKPYHSSPVIGIEDHQPEEIKFDNTKIRYIKKNINKEKFKFKLDIINHSQRKDFFKYENVTANIMTLTKKDGLKLDINKNVIENEIIVDSYEIVKVQYTCDSCSEKSTDLRTFEETYFFAPKKNLIVKEKISHFINELEYKPNCSINDYKFAYFYYVKFENTKSTIDELRDNGNKNFVLENNKVLYNNKNPNGILSCVYKMVNEEYTVSQQYELNVEGVIKVDNDGKKYLATKKTIKDLENANKTMLGVVIGATLIVLIVLISFLFLIRAKIINFIKSLRSKHKENSEDK
ncbi:Hypothetical protein SRAE_2000150500 [Strongyloides ratti]|uniref:Uncharacterized protein n=1 Tax=Strongyloides ratti TaxID=34506 RepID=A0A090MYA4_STRRB|nr:Hypothetical protein SRAE_2000150500 [Strongyloides ratti]CEF66839.1 Hypothetical protein SRAE_2000150500 [Strongyloides ratti]